ncbi:MAG: hypothetical protein ACREH3_00225, partial [Geminicoccales bacterium]
MGHYLGRRSLHSLVSLAGLIVLVFFLARLTGDPTNLYLPLDASLEACFEWPSRTVFDEGSQPAGIDRQWASTLTLPPSRLWART